MPDLQTEGRISDPAEFKPSLYLVLHSSKVQKRAHTIILQNVESAEQLRMKASQVKVPGLYTIRDSRHKSMVGITISGEDRTHALRVTDLPL